MNRLDTRSIVLSSITYANKAQKLLAQNAVFTSIYRSEAVKSVHGCGYAIRVPEPKLGAALNILNENGINVLGVL